MCRSADMKVVWQCRRVGESGRDGLPVIWRWRMSVNHRRCLRGRRIVPITDLPPVNKPRSMPGDVIDERVCLPGRRDGQEMAIGAEVMKQQENDRAWAFRVVESIMPWRQTSVRRR